MKPPFHHGTLPRLRPLLGAATLFLLPALLQAAGETVQVWRTSSDLSAKLTRQADLSFTADSGSGGVAVKVDPALQYQQMDGFGVSMTDTSTWLIATKLSDAKRSEVMQSLFGPDGIGMSMLRQTIGACDFNREMYSYAEVAGDTELTHFSIAKDEEFMVPLVKQAMALNPSMKIMASPWSPPGWMKTTGSMIGGSLKTENYPTMAKYFVKYVQAYGAHKIPIFAVTPQNEPGYSPTRYPGCLYSASAQMTFIRDHLAPAFTTAGLDTKIICYDHNYDGWSIPLQILANEATRNVTAGAAFHHYGGDPSMMTSLHDYFPTRDIWFTEGGIGDWNNTFDNLAHEMISIPRNWAKSIIFWNAALDQDDGPALIGVNNTNQGMVTIRSDAQDNVTYNAQYYYMGHLSKFVKPGAWRVDSPNWDGTLESVAFRNPDNSLVLVVFNKQSSQSAIRIQWLDKAVQATLPAKSLTTFVWNAKPQLSLTQAGGTVVAGTPTTLAVSNAGGMPVTYQWKRNGVAIEGATAAQLTLTLPSSLDAGQYTCVATATDGATSEVSTDLVVTPLITANTAARLVNISTRSQVAGGEGTQTVGFVIEGTQSKRILLRAAGPALSPWLSNYIPNPRLRLNDVTRGLVVTENDDWDYDTIFTTAHALQAFDWTAGSKDAALLVTLEPGMYTAEVSDATGATGIALVEAYEADGSSRCVNISTRSPVGPGFDNQVAGFVIKGTGIKTVLIRASGPALKQWLTGTLEDPVLEVFNDKGVQVFQNDNWDAASVHSIAQTLKAFDWTAGSKDAALIVSLPAGLYTATVKGANSGTGVALVEVYEVNK